MIYLSDERRSFRRLSPTLCGDIVGDRRRAPLHILPAEYRAQVSIDDRCTQSYTILTVANAELLQSAQEIDDCPGCCRRHFTPRHLHPRIYRLEPVEAGHRQKHYREDRPSRHHRRGLKVHLWSWNPTAEINGLTLKNPPWADRDLMFGAKQITLSVSLGRLFRGQIVIPQIEMIEPVINLERDSQGRASWQLGTNTGTPKDLYQASKNPRDPQTSYQRRSVARG
jgi:AsmA family